MNRSFQRAASGQTMSRAVTIAILAAFAIFIAFLGGSSRPDAAQNVLLRPTMALFLIPALYLLTKDVLRPAKIPLLLLLALGLWMAMQLVPLPPSFWQSLPDRGVIAELDALAGNADMWRPISLVPARGINALLSLVIPLAAMIIVLGLRIGVRDILIALAMLGAADGLLGILQLVSGGDGPLYLYAVTNKGAAVGLFANANHSAVFSSIVMLVAARLFLNPRWCRDIIWLRVFSAATFMLAFMAVIISSSRAGLVTGLLALACSVVMAYTVASQRPARPRASSRPSRKQAQAGRLSKMLSPLFADPRKLATIGIVVIIALSALFVLGGRAAGLEDVLVQDAFEDLRWDLAPILVQMMGNYWMVGSGFGSFEEVYHLYEPTELMFTRYVNQAHNDWAQLIMEGGLPAIILLVAALLWIARCVLVILRDAEGGRLAALFWATNFGIIMAASLPDYPLRAPVFQVVAVWLIVALALETHERLSAARPG